MDISFVFRSHGAVSLDDRVDGREGVSGGEGGGSLCGHLGQL